MPIQLNAGDIITYLIGGVLNETIDAIAVDTLFVDYTNNSVVVDFRGGTPADNSFAPNATVYQSHWFQVDTVSGNWSGDTGSGTLTAPELATLNGNLKNARNGGEGLVLALGALSGTDVPWT